MDRICNQALSTLQWFYVDMDSIYSSDCYDILLTTAAIVWNVFCSVVWFVTLPLTVPTIILVQLIQLSYKPSSPVVFDFQEQETGQERPDQLVQSVFGNKGVSFPDNLAKASLEMPPIKAEAVSKAQVVTSKVGSISEKQQQYLDKFWEKFKPEKFKIDDAHFFAVDLTIPPADDQIDASLIQEWFTFLQNAKKLPPTVQDDFYNIYIKTFYNTVKESFSLLLNEHTNVIRHVLFVFACRWKQIETMPNPEKQKEIFYNDMWGALRDIGLTFYHCKNRKSTAYEDVFYEYALPYLKPNLKTTNKKLFTFYTLADLCQMRREIFDQATSIVEKTFVHGERCLLPDPHSAGTKTYWRRVLGKTYGIPASLSEKDFDYESSAIQTYIDAEDNEVHVSDRIDQWFKESYTVDAILKRLRSRCGNMTDLLQGQRFEKWLRLTFPDFDEIRYALLSEEDYQYRPEVFVCLLVEAGVFVQK